MRVFRLFPDNPEVAYPSSHRRFHGAEDMLASVPATPVDKERAARHYSALAAQARAEADWIPEGEPLDPEPFTIEHEVGHLVMTGEIDAEEAMLRLAGYERVFHSDMGDTVVHQ